jgi:hypothetical protein
MKAGGACHFVLLSLWLSVRHMHMWQCGQGWAERALNSGGLLWHAARSCDLSVPGHLLLCTAAHGEV